MAITNDTRTPAQQAAHEKLRKLSRRNGKDIGEHHLGSHAIDVAIVMEIRGGPVTDEAIVDRIRDGFGMPIKSNQVANDLAYTSGRTGKVATPWIVLDKENRVVRLKKPRYPEVTQDIVAFLDGAATRRKATKENLAPPTKFTTTSPQLPTETTSFLSIADKSYDSALEDAAQGGTQGLVRLANVAFSQEQFELAQQRARKVGKDGEELINQHFAQERKRGRIESYQWVSKDHPISPFDFVLIIAGEHRKIEIKATEYDFKQPLHISLNELRCMRHSKEPYHLYRLYNLKKNRAILRIARDVAIFAERILCALSGLPKGVTVDSISLKPETIGFDGEMVIEPPSNKAVPI